MDPDAVFQEAVDAHYAALFRYALSLSQKESDAADLVQQTYAIYARKGHQIRDPQRVKPWLFTTLRREFYAMRREAAHYSAELSEEAYSAPLAPERLSALDGDTLIEALGALPLEYREPLTLFYLEEFTYQDIATHLNIPIGTVMSRLSRAKARLRKILSS